MPRRSQGQRAPRSARLEPYGRGAPGHSSGCRLSSRLLWAASALAIRRSNHRNHRRVLVVDGRVGFKAGIGVGEPWTGDGRQPRCWRRTDLRVEGPSRARSAGRVRGDVAGGHRPAARRRRLLSAPAAPWAPDARGRTEPAGESGDGGYILFLLAIDYARSAIALTNPYFLPDGGIAPAAERGVDSRLSPPACRARISIGCCVSPAGCISRRRLGPA